MKLVLLRHGESLWNRENKFTGWTDIDLSDTGINEAKRAGKILKEKGYTFDIAYTSVLKRAIRTLWIVMDKMDLMWLPVVNAWQLNERHYGALQGLSKTLMAKKYGEEKVHLWRRSFDTKPPLDKIKKSDMSKYYGLKKIPSGESLKDTVKRVIPYWKKSILPNLVKGKKVIVVAHGNSLRALIKHLDNISNEKISELNIPTGFPLVYELDKKFMPLKHYYLGDEKELNKAKESVALQGKVK